MGAGAGKEETSLLNSALQMEISVNVETAKAPVRHDRYGYQRGCRCASCCRANAEYSKALYWFKKVRHPHLRLG